MRRILHSPVLIPVAMILVLAVAFLSGGHRTVDEQGRPIVVYAHPPCPPRLMDLYRPVWEEFRKTHPDIDFRVLHITGNYEDKIKVMFAGRVAPDVIFMYPTALAAWAELGTLEPLDAYIERHPEVSRDDYFSAMLDTFSYDGALYGLPKDASADLMEYNVEMFERYGVSTPTPDWTWEDLLAAAKALTHDTDGDGRADQWGMIPYDWSSFVWQNGGRILDATGTKCMLLEPEAVEAIEFWAALRWEHGVTPTPEASADLAFWQLFALGRVGMFFEMYPVVSVLREPCDFEWDIAHLPRGPRARATRAVGSALAVTTQSRNKEAAFEWIRWMTSPAGMKGLVRVESPSCVALAQSPEFLESPGRPASKSVAVEAMAYAHKPPQHPLYFEILDAITPHLDKAQRGVITVRQALEAAVPEVDRILARRKEP